MYMTCRLGYIVGTFFWRSPKRAVVKSLRGIAFNSPNWSQNVLT
jgi:hypothetical protein